MRLDLLCLRTLMPPAKPSHPADHDGRPASRAAAPGQRVRRCQRCHAILRRTNNGVLCGPCERLTKSVEPLLPPDFYETPGVVEALANRDFGRFFRLARTHLHATQEQLGLMVGLAQSHVCKVESGGSRLRDIEAVVRVASALRIPAQLLGFAGRYPR